MTLQWRAIMGIIGFLLIAICYISGYKYGIYSQQLKWQKINTKIVTKNLIANSTVESPVIVTREKIIYKTQYLKQAVAQKANTTIDINIDNYWTNLINQSIESN